MLGTRCERYDDERYYDESPIGTEAWLVCARGLILVDAVQLHCLE